MNIVFDHYTGFEGEPEIIFKTADGNQTADLWNGDFSSIMKNAVPNDKGWWESLALLYHTNTGWHASSPFELIAVDEALFQLKTCFSDSWNKNMLQVYSDLIIVFEYASKYEISIFIEYS